MSLLLTRHVDQYRIDVRHWLRFGGERLRTRRCEPFADQLAMKPIMLDHQYPFHRWLPL